MHETFVGILIALAVVHICVVIVSSYVDRESMILAMITGNKKVE